MAMKLNPEISRRGLLPLLAVLLGLGYVFVLKPLDRQSAKLDLAQKSSWNKLAAALGKTNAAQLDFVGLTNQFTSLTSALETLEEARKQGRARTELNPELRSRLEGPFQLVDYETASSQKRADLARFAGEQKVTLDPSVFAGFPERTADMQEPALLWAELELLNSMLTVAIYSKVTAIHSVAALRPVTRVDSRSGLRSLTELPLRIELTGPSQSVGRFLQALPLRTDEIKAAGLTAPEHKPAIFIDRIIVKKQSPEKTDEVHLSLQATGFVFPQ